MRADFNGGALSSDVGALLLQSVDRQTGLIDRLTSAIQDKRHRKNLATRFLGQHCDRIYSLYRDQKKLEVTAVKEFSGLSVIGGTLGQTYDYDHGLSLSPRYDREKVQGIIRWFY